MKVMVGFGVLGVFMIFDVVRTSLQYLKLINEKLYDLHIALVLKENPRLHGGLVSWRYDAAKGVWDRV
jgi:hypothetical protein